jgi:nicotinate-nucleotide adenylyltransferase
MATAEDRCQMCRLAAVDDAYFSMQDLEIRRGGSSYTIDTVRALKQLGWNEVHWLIGADQLMDLPRWKEPDALLREAKIVIMRRPGTALDWNKLPSSYHRLQENVVEAPLVDISATEIRRRVANGESIDGLTPPAVIDYIRKHGLYRATA